MARTHQRAGASRPLFRSSFLVLPFVLACGQARDAGSATDTGAADSPIVIEGDFARPGPPCPAGATYAIGDTSDWATMIEEGKRAVLRAGATIIDTVDVLFGVHAVGRDSLIFLPVLAYEVDSTEAAAMSAPAAWPTDHVLCTPQGRRPLSDLVPHFNSGFSSPTIIDSTVYYWGMNPQNNQGRYRLYAMRYSPRHARLDSLFLREEAPATDYRYFYGPPFEENGAIVFEGGDARAIIDPGTWRVLRLEPRSSPAATRGSLPGP